MTPKQQDRAFIKRLRLACHPTADPKALVNAGEARFTVLTDRLIRMEWALGGQFDDRGSYAFPTRHAAPPKFRVSEKKGWLVVDTGAVKLEYKQGSGRFGARNLRAAFKVGKKTVTWRPGMVNPGNLLGARRTLDGCPAEATMDPGILSRDGWVLFDDSGSVRFDDKTGWIAAPAEEPEAAKPQQDLYLFAYGHDYRAALSDYTQFGHAVPMIPRYSLGLWWSRYWDYTAQDLKDLVKLFDVYDIPIDVLVIDMDWHTKDAWTGYSWDYNCFPDPEAFLGWCRDQQLRTTLNLHPHAGVQPFEHMYADFVKAMDGKVKDKEAVPFRVSDPRYMRNYFELLHHPREREGVDFWWMDWQQGEGSEVPNLDPLIWLNHVHFQDNGRDGKRPMLFSRWGGLGNHRYPYGFSGDTFARWEVLNFMPHFTATASNVLFGWWSHDIGGHFNAPDAEQYVRWVQFGALSPCLRLHATKDPLAERRPWAFSERALEEARNAIQLRYKLLPYLYTTARQAHETGVGPCRPMYYEHPESEDAYAARWQYYLGDQLIAAPIVSPAGDASGMAATSVWIPEGTWIDCQTLETFTGPKWVRIVGDVGRHPLLTRAGAIVPWAEPRSRTANSPMDLLRLRIYPGGSGQYRHYEDDAQSQDYRKGQCEWTLVESSEQGKQVSVTIHPVEGRCPVLPEFRRVEMIFPGRCRPECVMLDGERHQGWDYDEGAQALTVRIPESPKAKPIKVTVEAGRTLGSNRNAGLAACDAGLLLAQGAAATTTGGLIEAAYATEGSAADNALARLGGPFADFYDFAIPPEAKRALGMAIIGGPADGSRFQVRGKWTLCRAGETREFPIDETLMGDRVLYTPFYYDPEADAQHWRAALTITWNGQSREHVYQSRCLRPTITCWHAAVIDREGPDRDDANAILANGELDPRFEWEAQEHDTEPKNLTEEFWFRWPKTALDRLVADAEPTLYAAARITSDKAQRAVLRLYEGLLPHKPLQDSRFYLNGEVVNIGPDHLEAPVKLKKGLNRLVVHVHLVGRDLLSMYLLDPVTRLPLTNLRYS